MINRYGYLSGWVVSALALLVFAGLTSLSFVFIVHNGHVDCLRLHEQTNLPTKYARSGPSGECYIQLHDGTWTPEDRWINIKEAS
jgi:hypothetical protein